jgi:hypothetical protein
MDVSTVIKCVIIALLVFAGYYVVTGSSRSANKRNLREGFSFGSSDSSSSSSSSSSGDTPGVTAKSSSDVLTTNTQNMLNMLQTDTNRDAYEGLIEIMDAWTQAKVLASLNAVAAQMIADSSDQNAMMAPPSDKTVALMNGINTMMQFQTAIVPHAFKTLDSS